MINSTLPWATLLGLLFTTMGPVRAVSVFASYGESDRAPGVRPLAARSVGLATVAFVLAVLMGDQTLARSGVGLPALIGAAGFIIVVFSVQAMLSPVQSARQEKDVTSIRPADVAFPGIFPPIAVSIPIIFAAAAPTFDNKVTIIACGIVVLAIDWLAMIHAKSILKSIGPTPLQLLGAVFGVLQVALGFEFLFDAYHMSQLK